MRNFFTSLNMAYRSVISVKWKSMVSIITFLVGSLAITSTFSISFNIDLYVQYLIDKEGGPKLTMYSYDSSKIIGKQELGFFEKISTIKKIYPYEESFEKIRYGNKVEFLRFIPLSPDNFQQLPLRTVQGRFFSFHDLKSSENFAVLSDQAMSRLGFRSRENPFIIVRLKTGVEIPLRVIGISKMDTAAMDSGSILIDFKLFKEITGKKTMTQLHVFSKTVEQMDWVEKFIYKALGSKFGQDIWIVNPFERFKQQKEQLHSFLVMGYILGLLALIAGSIGSTSVMLFNINLRRREIGLYKALGFSRPIILMQFTCETFILSSLGGLIGSCLGLVLGYIISSHMFPVTTISFWAMQFGLLSAVVVGVLFGLIPSLIAANLDPVKALQGS